MHTRPIYAAAITAAALLTAGCSGSNKAEPAPTVTVTVTATPSAHDGATADKQAADSGPLKLGDSMQWTAADIGASGTSTALAYTQPVRGVSGPEQSGEEWAQVEAKVCTDTGKVKVSQFPWKLAFADGTRVEVTGMTGGDFPRPEFPMDATVKAGDCVRGLIMFPVPKGKRPERVLYAPDSAPESAEWTVPAK